VDGGVEHLLSVAIRGQREDLRAETLLQSGEHLLVDDEAVRLVEQLAHCHVDVEMA
jgi:hypothetical protein